MTGNELIFRIEKNSWLVDCAVKQEKLSGKFLAEIYSCYFQCKNRQRYDRHYMEI